MRTGMVALAAVALMACGSDKDGDTGTASGALSGTIPGGTTSGTAGGTPTGTTGGTPTGTTGGTPTSDCGNSALDPGEDCDGVVLDGTTCTDLGYQGGTLACDNSCGWELSGCTGPISNAPTCATYGQIGPAYGEEGHWVLGRITPPRYPFTVTEIGYSSVWAPYQGCSPEFAHLAEVWAGTDPTPIADPVAHEQFVVPTGTSSLVDRDFSHALTTPLVLQQDEYLFIAVQTAGFYPYVTCIETCIDPGSVPEHSWWSNAVATPFSWATLGSFGIDATLDVHMTGTP